MNLITAFFLLALSSIFAHPALAANQAHAATLTGTPLPFYVYKAYKDRDNHFAASGWMGDYRDIKLNERYVDPKNSALKPVIQISYGAKSAQGNGWTGIYWQNPPNNWGTKQGGFNLNGAKKLVFMARGDKGGEVAEFKIGGISGDYSDSGSAAIGPVTLTKDWKEYQITLEGQELSSISGGFCWTMTRDQNPDGAVFYLDNIRYE